MNPPMAGYSGTPLIKKLGINSGQVAIIVNSPANYKKLLGKLPAGAKLSERVTSEFQFLHFFSTDRADLAKQLRNFRAKIADTGVLWVSWPKKSAKVATDITEDVIRAVALPLGFVDTKVCAVDETWSGLKLMIRRENRKQKK
jgi:hypothetical protein